MDWDLIIGWMGDTAEEGGSSWRGRRGGAKSSLSANVKFSVTIRLFALLGRCDSEFDVKRSVLSGASGMRVGLPLLAAPSDPELPRSQSAEACVQKQVVNVFKISLTPPFLGHN